MWGGLDLVRGSPELPHFLGFVGAGLMALGAARVLTRRAGSATLVAILPCSAQVWA
jgi:hypothetical protein